MNKYQSEKYEREVKKMDRSAVNKKIQHINTQIADCLANNRKKKLRQVKQEKKILERYQ